jgi:hypothetical protein
MLLRGEVIKSIAMVLNDILEILRFTQDDTEECHSER